MNLVAFIIRIRRFVVRRATQQLTQEKLHIFRKPTGFSRKDHLNCLSWPLLDVAMLAATATVVLRQRAFMFVVNTSYLCHGSANELLTFRCS